MITIADNTPIIVYTAECIGNAANCLYPNEVKITDAVSAKLAFATDMVCARYKNNYRNTANFEVANALPGDCDNDHSDEPADWVTPEDIADLFADVSYVLHYSRHHMKPKGEKSARPRFHIVFLIDPERDADRYTALKQRLLVAFPFFDANAMDAARFLFGTEDPQVIYHPGTITLNAFLDDLENEQAFANMGRAIPEGSRNSTMSRIGARIIKRYGDTPEAKDLFLQAAEQCSPPLEDRELEGIWAGKQRLYSKICKQPGYIPPDAYNSTVQAEIQRRKEKYAPTKPQQTSPFRRRVAAYARVSTDSEEQLTSYEAQVDYYTKFIQENPDWDFVEVYTDEGISAVNTKRRDGFNRMIRDALAGKIDLIVTKSVSRFARNTVDSLTTIRKLKEAGCECFFQKENIMTFDSKGELLITIMSSLAQEESRSISENVTWGQRKRFSDGKVSIPYGQFLGYRKGADGLPEIIPEEAETVRRIYREFLQGKSTNAIATMLTVEGIPTPGKKTVWQRATVESILRNEKYKGSALLQKSFTVDFLTKKTKINEGEVPQYYVEDSHPAIIEPWEWEQVQVELERRKNSRNRHHQTSPFSGKIVCADCGDIFGAKTWHSTDRYRRVIWQCNGKFKGERKCETPHLTEERLKELYLAALGEYLSDRDAAIDQLRYTQRMLTDTDFIDADIQALEEELTTITGMLRLCITENAANAMTEETYRTTHDELCSRFEETEAKLAALQKQRDKMKADAVTIGGMMFELGELDTLPVAFDEKLWHDTIDHITVRADEQVVFRFKDGKEIVTML